MSTAAARAQEPRKLGTPPWTRRGHPWGALPHVTWNKVCNALSGLTVMQVLGYLSSLCPANDDVANVTQSALAKGTELPLRTVEAAIAELVLLGLIEKVKESRRNSYRLLVDSWQAVKKPAPKLVVPEEDDEEEDDVEETGVTPIDTPIDTPRSAPPVDIETGTAVPISLRTPTRTIQCENLSGYPLTVEATFNAAVLSLRLTSKACVANNEVNATIPAAQHGYPDPELDALRDMLTRVLGPRLGPLSPDDLTKIHAAKGTATVNDLELRISARAAMFRNGKGTWGGAIKLAEDVAKAAQAAVANNGVKPTIPAAQHGYPDNVLEDAKRELTDPFLPEEDRRLLTALDPLLATWQPTPAEQLAVVRRKAEHVKQSLASKGTNRVYIEQQKALRERIRSEFPTVYAEVFGAESRHALIFATS